MKSVAIIGAGLAGLVAARELASVATVTVFEKSRGLGGRMATRRADPFAFDHGAQYFTAKGERFQKFLAPFIKTGVVENWQPDLVKLSSKGHSKVEKQHPSYVAVPGMNGLAKTLASGLYVRNGIRIETLKRSNGEWFLLDENAEEHGPFDLIVSAVPSHQALDLLPADFAHLEQVAKVKMQACFTLMLGFSRQLDFGFSGAFAEDEVIGWIAVNSSKPGRQADTSLLVQTRNDWAETHQDDEKAQVAELMKARVSDLTGIDCSSPDHEALHRWLYASTLVPADVPFLYDEEKRIAAIGDWCIGGRVEAAFDSAIAFGERFKTRA